MAGRLIVVDPCVGNGKTREQPFWNAQTWPFMERFEAAGFDRADVDMVVHTHLHVDHVGWDTHLLDGRWVPTFGTHFPTLPGGRITGDGSAWHFLPEAGTP